MSYIEIVVQFIWSQIFVINWDTFKRYWLMQNDFFTLKALSWNLGTLCVLFYRIRKTVCFFLKSDLIPKLHLLKPMALLSIMLIIMVVILMGDKPFCKRIYGEVILNTRTNYQRMPRWERSLINDKSILQHSEHCKSSLAH